ncbi:MULTISPECIES: polysaccharide biosynthesis tyrosine autokinase [unclassified Anabaena]|uniref:GumC family protein n=1 Tax=unclassified Anabaena TaxID=2619674 RepID=UPI00082BEB76|nr:MULTISPECIES: polysaccharide biosynthesis tyrosine autokinase [unclassified Anabaena]
MGKGVSTLLAVLRRRSLPAITTFAAVIGASIAYLNVTPRLYETSARLMVNNNRVSVSELGRDLTELRSTGGISSSPLADQAELVNSQAVLERAIAKVFPESENNSAQNTLTLASISPLVRVKIVPATNILELSYQHPDPNFAAKILNAVAQAMVEENIQTIRSEATKVREFLEKEVPLARQRLQQAEVAENKYRQQSGVVEGDSQTRSLVESLANIENQERLLLAQLQEARSRDASLRQITDTQTLDNAYSSVRSGQDEQLRVLRGKLTDLETQLIEARLQFTDSHPKVISLLGQRDSMRALYTQELARVSSNGQNISSADIATDQISQNLTSQLINNEIERLAIENKFRAVQAMKANLQSRLALLPIRQQPLTMLTRQRAEAEASLQLLQNKLEEARIAEAQKVSNIRIIETAQLPIAPASPRPLVVIVIATFFGTILATGIVLLLETMDNRLYDVADAEELLKLPLLGVLPSLPATRLSLEPAEKFLDDVGLVEPYRMLLKNLEFRSTDKLQIVIVSSSISGEGKSVVVAHLAAVAAMLSRKTLIIDADLRRPSQHTLFNLAPKPGITDVIDGNKSLLSAAQTTDIENLFVLTCGELRGRPSQILESDAMKSLVSEAALHYDLVIIDTPPLSACADAATLSQYSDGVILTTRPGFTLKEVLQRAVSELNQNRIPILGVVVNGMTKETETYYRYAMESNQSLLSRPFKRLATLGSGEKDSDNDLRLK